MAVLFSSAFVSGAALAVATAATRRAHRARRPGRAANTQAPRPQPPFLPAALRLGLGPEPRARAGAGAGPTRPAAGRLRSRPRPAASPHPQSTAALRPPPPSRRLAAHLLPPGQAAATQLRARDPVPALIDRRRRRPLLCESDPRTASPPLLAMAAKTLCRTAESPQSRAPSSRPTRPPTRPCAPAQSPRHAAIGHGSVVNAHGNETCCSVRSSAPAYGVWYRSGSVGSSYRGDRMAVDGE